MSIWQSWMPVCCSVLFQSVCSVLSSFVRECKMGVRPFGGREELMKVCKNCACGW